VGGKLIGQIKKQFQYLQDELHLQIQVIGLANSKKILVNEEGIDLNSWKEQLQNGENGSIHDFVKRSSAKISATACLWM
jgi:aspartokinase/homoserine dehydrogenase 1